MGLFDWFKRKDSADASMTTVTVTTHGASLDAQDPEQREALEQAERLIHEFLTAGAEQAGAAGAEQEGAGEESAGEENAGESDAGAFVFTGPAQVIVAGEAVSADDPRALGAMRTAAAKLREHGLDELAAELETRAAAGPTAADAAAATGPAATGPAAPSQAQPSAGPAAVEDAPAGAADEAPGAPADDLGDAPSAPAPPEPPAPPS